MESGRITEVDSRLKKKRGEEECNRDGSNLEDTVWRVFLIHNLIFHVPQSLLLYLLTWILCTFIAVLDYLEDVLLASPGEGRRAAAPAPIHPEDMVVSVNMFFFNLVIIKKNTKKKNKKKKGAREIL